MITAFELSSILIQLAVVCFVAHKSRWCYNRAQEYINVNAFRQGDMLLTDSKKYAAIALVLLLLTIVNVLVRI